jgi:heterodisulfide reductase subunit B
MTKEQVIEKLACFMCPVNFACDGKGVKGCTGSLDKARSFFKDNKLYMKVEEKTLGKKDGKYKATETIKYIPIEEA